MDFIDSKWPSQVPYHNVEMKRVKFVAFLCVYVCVWAIFRFYMRI